MTERHDEYYLYGIYVGWSREHGEFMGSGIGANANGASKGRRRRFATRQKLFLISFLRICVQS